MKVLFICAQGLHRSRTAGELFSDKFETRYAGLFSEKPVSEKQITWADVIVVMEDFHREEISKRFPELYMKKRIISLDIPDIYQYNQPELVEILKERVNKLVITARG